MNLGLLSESEFLRRAEKIVEINLSEEEFGVRELAAKLEISRTHLHRKIKSTTNKSVSRFIREVRLSRAREMLQDDQGTISEVAYRVGFGSPSYFIKCFRDHFGSSPGAYLKSNPEEQPVENEVSQPPELYNTTNFFSQPERTGTGLMKIISGIAGILIITAFAGFIYRYSSDDKQYSGNKQNAQDKTIAVLPLKNLSENLDNQHLADGIMEDILNRLSHVSELKVKSRITSEKYRNPEQTLPEIASEMNVSYVLEGSILSTGNRVRIYIQLIEAENDHHIWSDEYNRDSANIFEFISNVSKQVSDELQVVLSTREIQDMEKRYTEDIEAYNLYLMGRYFWHRKTTKDLIRCIQYYTKAIERDSTYSLAYAGIADAYNSLTWSGYYSYNEGVEKCRKNALEAIRLDPYLAEAHASLGDCASDFLWDWELAEKELKLAINLNPNYALAHKYYGDHLDRMGKTKLARKHINRAVELNPLATSMYSSRIRLCYNEGDVQAILEDIERRSALDSSFRFSHFMRFKIHLLEGRHDQAFGAYKNWISSVADTTDFEDTLNLIYAESGIKGVVRWNIDHFYTHYHPDENYQAAAFHAYLGDKESAIDCLEKEYNNKERRYRLSMVKNDYDYKTLHGHPRFTALLEKMNLSGK